jgi:hypothetical protein
MSTVLDEREALFDLVLEESLRSFLRKPFDPAKHPHGRGGRWAETLGTPHTPEHLEHFAAKLDPLPIQRKQVKSLPAATSFQRARRRIAYTREWGPHGDEFTYDLAFDHGYTGRPHVVSTDRLEAEIANGATEMFRGQSDRSYAEAFTTGPYFAGQGFRGNGIYFAYGGKAHATAHQYAQAPPTRGVTAKTDAPTVMRAALHRDAKVVDYDEIAALAKAEHERLAAIAGDPGESQFASSDQVRAEVARDPARYAITQGYDAIKIPGGEMIVLNRSVVIVSEEFEDAGTNVVRRSKVAA